jgi:hypothetical protein
MKKMAPRVNKNLTSEDRVTSHDAVIHKLDTAYKYDDQMLAMNSDAFEKSINKWAEAKLIYGYYHPDMDIALHAPGLAAITNNAVEVGRITKAWIDKTGHCKLMANFEFSGDYVEELEKLTKEGLLSLSSGFHSVDSLDEDTGLIRFDSVTPNHVLLFVESEYNRPRDTASGIVNKQEVGDRKIMTEELAKTNADLRVKNEDLNARISKAEADVTRLTAELTAKTHELAASGETVKALTEANALYEKERLENEWSVVISTQLPAAITKDAAKLEAEKASFFNDPNAYYRNMAHKNAVTSMAGRMSAVRTGSETDAPDPMESAKIKFKGKEFSTSEWKAFCDRGMK